MLTGYVQHGKWTTPRSTVTVSCLKTAKSQYVGVRIVELQEGKRLKKLRTNNKICPGNLQRNQPLKVQNTKIRTWSRNCNQKMEAYSRIINTAKFNNNREICEIKPRLEIMLTEN